MVLRTASLCEHASYHGGQEKQFHRGANGHTRFITCKDCEKSVILAKRNDPAQLWAYLVTLALCTKWGSAARSRELAATVGRLTLQDYDQDQRQPRELPATQVQGRARLSGGHPSPPRQAGYHHDVDDWNLVTPSSAAAASSAPGARPVARIIHKGNAAAWLYGFRLNPFEELPPFPDLQPEDLHILQPLPGDMSAFSDGPFAGRSYVEVASYASPEFMHYNASILEMALRNKPMAAEVYRYAFYLYGRLTLVNSAALRILKSESAHPTDQDLSQALKKRTQDIDAMQTSRCIQVPLQYDPGDLSAVNIHYCDVMMVDDQDAELAFVLTDQDQPGLAILDSGCTRTMHGSEWASTFEKSLAERGLSPKIKQKVQRFRGVGGETVSKVVKIYLVGIGKAHGELHSAECEGMTPLLLSRPFMQELGAVIDLSDNTVSFKELGVAKLPLIRTTRGHMAIDLLNFGAGLEDSFHEYIHSSTLKVEDALKAETSEQHLANDDNLIMAHADGEDLEEFLARTMDCEYGSVCDDADVFHSEMGDGAVVIRHTTGKKGKKLDLMNQNLDSEDLVRGYQLRGQQRPKVQHRPPTGKTWVKQIFAGQMGLTILAALYGMTIGIPLDYSTSDWDARDGSALRRLHQDLAVEDPYLLVITHPCGPWGSWSKFNLAKGGKAADTVLSLRDESRPILKLVNKIIKERVKGKRHVFVEQPYGSDSIEEPEMTDVRKLVEDGSLLAIKVDGCQVGYFDKESGLPHYKPSFYLTTMLAAESMFADLRCTCIKHEPLEGNNRFGSRTAQAAEWPEKLDKMVLECAVQQSYIETSISHYNVDSISGKVDYSYPVHHLSLDPQQQRSPKRTRRRGRVATLTPQYNAPPVYIRPDTSAEAIPPDDDQPDIHDQDVRARAALELDPILTGDEADRRRQWLAVDPEIRKIIRDLHVNFGHPTSVTLQRILRRQGAKPEAIRAAGLMSCDSCGESIRRKRPRPVRLPNQYQFNRHLFLDTFYARDVRGATFAFLNMIDDATSFQVVACFGELQGPPASRAVVRHFTTSWTSWAGLPHSLQVDRGKEYMAGIRSDSPTCSLLSFNLVCAIAALKGWTIASYDASTAYLQSSGIDRLLILKCPHPPPPGVRPGTLFRAKGSIYGTKDAGRSWWKKLVREVTNFDWKLSKLELALFYLYDGQTLVGVMGSHVDDLIVCGTGEKYQSTLEKLTTLLYLKREAGKFRHCGKNLVQHDDMSVSLEQVDAIEALEYQVLDKHRRKFPNLPLTEQEKSEFRGLIGSMGWISRQTRPDVLVNVSIASQSISKPCIRDVLELNKAVKMLKESSEAKWCFKAGGMTLEDCVVFTCADSSFANAEGLRSQCGHIVGLTMPSIKSGEETPVIILETASTSIKRVCRSTLAAEANAFLSGTESAVYVASLLREILNPGIPLSTLEREYPLKKVIAFTDAKSLESTIIKDAGQPSDKRVKILVAQIREMLGEECDVNWLDTSQMLADVLTKIGCERELMIRALEDGKWKIAPSEEALQRKAAIRAGRHQRKDKKKALEELAGGT